MLVSRMFNVWLQVTQPAMRAPVHALSGPGHRDSRPTRCTVPRILEPSASLVARAAFSPSEDRRHRIQIGERKSVRTPSPGEKADRVAALYPTHRAMRGGPSWRLA
jgi:hypothetical protein